MKTLMIYQSLTKAPYLCKSPQYKENRVKIPAPSCRNEKTCHDLLMLIHFLKVQLPQLTSQQ